MKDWQELGQSVVIGVIFLFLAAQLLSLISKFKNENLRIVHEEDLPPIKSNRILEDDDERETLLEENELYEQFNAACDFIAAVIASGSSSSSDGAVFSSEIHLNLYGLHKIATEGPCDNTPQFSEGAEWNAWQRLGNMSPEEAMQNYISVVTELYPFWDTESTLKDKDGDYEGSSSAGKRTMRIEEYDKDL